MTSQYGFEIMSEVRMYEYACDTYMLEGLIRESRISKVKTVPYTDYEAWFTGFLYKYWYDTRGTDPKKIYAIAPINKIGESFPVLHTQGWEYVIEHLIDKANNFKSITDKINNTR